MRQGHLRLVVLVTMALGSDRRVRGGRHRRAAAAVPAAAPAAPGEAGSRGGRAAGIDPVVVADERLAALRQKVLKDEDFVENEEVNRDPFHPYLRLFVDTRCVSKTQEDPRRLREAGPGRAGADRDHHRRREPPARCSAIRPAWARP